MADEMADEMRTECGQKLQKKRCMSQLDYITIYTKRSYRFCIQSALTIKGYLEQFFDGVSFRGCIEKKNILKVPYSLLNNEDKPKMLKDNHEEDCSITEMAKKVGLSRIRFYQLRKEGVFPEPDDSSCPNHSFYTLQSQQKCIEIRKTGIGLNGKPIIFNAPRIKKPKKSRKPRNQQNNRYEELAATLRQWKWDVTHIDVKNAVKIKYPEGLEQHPDDGLILRDVIDHLIEKASQNSNETVK